MAPPPARGLRCVWRGGGEDTGNWQPGDVVSSGQGRGARIMGVNCQWKMLHVYSEYNTSQYHVVYILDGGKLDDFEFEQHLIK